MRFAVISDIHSNLQALEAVLADVERHHVKSIFCLGDLVGYGGNPREVIDLAMDFNFCLRGNHDDAVTFKVPKKFNITAAKSVFWTRDQILPHKHSGPRARRRWNFMRRKLKRLVQIEDAIFAHGTPGSYFEYVDNPGIAEELLEDNKYEVKTIFVGHTHVGGAFFKDNGKVRFLHSSSPKMPGYRSRKMIVNVGSVGQPRDGDIRACYVLVGDEGFYFRRIPYKVKEAIDTVFNRIGLPNDSGERLSEGH
ncbi:MAG: metallophosphoesterase family protein [Planctomycetota bacterium]|jgi:predicted phosphodiesterase